jgi:hypothetical protein
MKHSYRRLVHYSVTEITSGLFQSFNVVMDLLYDSTTAEFFELRFFSLDVNEHLCEGHDGGFDHFKDFVAFVFSKRSGHVLMGDMTMSEGRILLRKTYIDIGCPFVHGRM